MPDISMCNGVRVDNNNSEMCPLRNSCYRYLATPSEFRQSFFVDAPFIKEPDGTSCEYYWKELE